MQDKLNALMGFAMWLGVTRSACICQCRVGDTYVGGAVNCGSIDPLVIYRLLAAVRLIINISQFVFSYLETYQVKLAKSDAGEGATNGWSGIET